MSLTLSITPQSHVFNDYPYGHASTLSSSSTDTVRYYGCHQRSVSALSGSKGKAIDDVHREDLHDAKTSQSFSTAYNSFDSAAATRVPAVVYSAGANLIGNQTTQNLSHVSPPFGPYPLSSELHGTHLANKAPKTLRPNEEIKHVSRRQTSSLFVPEEPCTNESSSFRRWLSTLRRRKHHLSTLSSYVYRPLLNGSVECVGPTKTSNQSVRSIENSGASISNNSSMFVTGIKTATLTIDNSTLASRGFPVIHSLAGWPKNNFARCSNRKSDDSEALSSTDPCGDQLVYRRAVQRREILDELLESEKSYVGDLKMLVNVYFTLLASVCALSTSTRDSIRENVTGILGMHERLLEDLQKVIHSPAYSLTQAEPSLPPIALRGHVRWHSADNAPSRARNSRFARKLRHSLDVVRPTKLPSLGAIADPQVVAAVAKLFNDFASQFLAYEEYGAKYEMMVQDLASTYKTLSASEAFQKGIEVLSKTLDSINDREPHSRKGMSFGDLLIKPIQRVCKYPLIFENLFKSTPVSDGPDAHAVLEKTLFRLRHAASQINKAKDDPKMRKVLETTWQLQDRLRFPDEVSLTVVHRLLGTLQLCGVLHVAYQSKTVVKGQYMLCALFKTCLVLALCEKGVCFYNVVASIPLENIVLEEPDSGRGLQCHTAPFSWKIVFESDHHLCELLLSACSKVEEEQWRKSLSICTNPEDIASMTTAFCSFLELDLRPIATLFGQSHSLASRLSIQRAATLGPRAQMNQVIIKNTQSPEHIPLMSSESSLPLGRSHSMLSSSQVPVLAPRRSERINLESALADIWTKEVLPFPGMKPTESVFRTSANHVMRKLSMASITSTLSKRTSSFVSFHKPESRVPTPIDLGLRVGKVREPESRAQRCPRAHFEDTFAKTVDFHTTPEAFLPPDFELKDPRRHKARQIKSTIRTVEKEACNASRLSSIPPNKNIPNTRALQDNRSGATTNTDGQMRLAVRINSPASNDENRPRMMHSSKNSKLIKENSDKTSKSLQPITKQLRRLFN